MKIALAALACATVSLAMSSPAAYAADTCAALKDSNLPNVKIDTAQAIPGGTDFAFPPSLFNGMPGAPKSTKAAFCRVAGTIDTEISFEVWLPKDWNGKFEGVGNGGLTGAINYPAMASALADGYATASTDTGHKTDKGFFQSDWIPGHPQRVTDFAYRAHHLMAEEAKQIIALYYKKSPQYSYYNGCSSGGWEGLSEAQRYPNDYDGIVAGAPAINIVRLHPRGIWTAQLAVKDKAGNLPPAKQKLLVDAALARCDAKDGSKDGVIDDPEHCDFDPAQIQCKSGDGPKCLTAAQVTRAKLLYGPGTTPAGAKLYPGSAWGAPPSVELPPGPGSDPAAPAMVLMLHQPPAWTLATFDIDKDVAPIEAELGSTLDTTNANLTAFQKHGGKLILYHGWADPLLSPYNTIDYYTAVEAKMGGAAQTESFARLFMVPGMGHCGGGAGTDMFDKVAALAAWVEKGKAPDTIPAAHMTNGKTDRTRPLCTYPKVATYTGSGDMNDAASFTCK